MNCGMEEIRTADSLSQQSICVFPDEQDSRQILTKSDYRLIATETIEITLD